jgi:hypothetical protein
VFILIRNLQKNDFFLKYSKKKIKFSRNKIWSNYQNKELKLRKHNKLKNHKIIIMNNFKNKLNNNNNTSRFNNNN